MSEPIGWSAFILIILIIGTALFGRKGKRGGYTREAPQPREPRPRPPGKEKNKNE